MSRNLESELHPVIRGFVEQVTALAKRVAVETLEAAFTRRPQVTAAIAPAQRRPGVAGKRSPTELQDLSDRFVRFVAAHPGLRIEQINKQLGTTTRALMLPIRKLLASGQIRTQGNKRSTTYHSANGQPSKRRDARRRRARRGRGFRASAGVKRPRREEAAQPEGAETSVGASDPVGPWEIQ
jgi:hypothetical protein